MEVEAILVQISLNTNIYRDTSEENSGLDIFLKCFRMRPAGLYLPAPDLTPDLTVFTTSKRSQLFPVVTSGSTRRVG